MIDNDNFAEDTLAGKGTTHTTNMGLLQSEVDTNVLHSSAEERTDNVLGIPTYALRRNLHLERTVIVPYKTNK